LYSDGLPKSGLNQNHQTKENGQAQNAIKNIAINGFLPLWAASKQIHAREIKMQIPIAIINIGGPSKLNNPVFIDNLISFQLMSMFHKR